MILVIGKERDISVCIEPTPKGKIHREKNSNLERFKDFVVLSLHFTSIKVLSLASISDGWECKRVKDSRRGETLPQKSFLWYSKTQTRCKVAPCTISYMFLAARREEKVNESETETVRAVSESQHLTPYTELSSSRRDEKLCAEEYESEKIAKSSTEVSKFFVTHRATSHYHLNVQRVAAVLWDGMAWDVVVSNRTFRYSL